MPLSTIKRGALAIAATVLVAAVAAVQSPALTAPVAPLATNQTAPDDTLTPVACRRERYDCQPSGNPKYKGQHCKARVVCSPTAEEKLRTPAGAVRPGRSLSDKAKAMAWPKFGKRK
jgi:hypothetical protein